jgi:hypothetical protein
MTKSERREDFGGDVLLETRFTFLETIFMLLETILVTSETILTFLETIFGFGQILINRCCTAQNDALHNNDATHKMRLFLPLLVDDLRHCTNWCNAEKCKNCTGQNLHSEK